MLDKVFANNLSFDNILCALHTNPMKSFVFVGILGALPLIWDRNIITLEMTI